MRCAALVLAALSATAVLAPAALADGDPASDVLVNEQVFYPRYTTVPHAQLKQLQATVAAANERGFTIRVAVITSPYDLGSVSALWEKPQPYCRFLSLELAFAYRSRLLVVSRKGYGYVEQTKPVPAKLSLVRTVPIGTGADGLVRSADSAVRLLASNAGYRLPAPSAGGSGSGMDTVVIAIAAAAGAALVAGVELFRRRRRRPSASEAAPP